MTSEASLEAAGPKIDRLRVHCAEGTLQVLHAGAAGPPVLLLSGAGVDNALLSWRHLIPVLAHDHRVYALDWPKQGGSRPWRGTADHDRLLRCVTEVLDQVVFGQPTPPDDAGDRDQRDHDPHEHPGTPDRRVDLVGLSQGGAIALAYAIEHPDEVRRLVAIAPAGILSFPPVVHQLLWLAARMPRLNRSLTGWLLSRRDRIARFARASLFAGPVADFDAIVDEIAAEVAAAQAHGGAGASDWQNGSIGFTRMRVDLRPRLDAIRSPTLFLQGDRDAGVPWRRTRDAAAMVPGARFELLPGHGHWLTRQSPERVNGLIADFLADVLADVRADSRADAG